MVEARRAPGFARNPGYRIDLETSPRRVRVVFADTAIADTTRALLMREQNHLPVYYFPIADVRMDRLVPTAHKTHCPYKGEASYWTIEAGGRRAENAVWGYVEPYVESAAIAGTVAFYWNRVDHWYEEDEEIFVHPRDPYKRVDVVESRRPVEVILGGTTVARTARARFLFETGLPTRYYIPEADVRMDVFVPSATVTACPYKGRARYWSAAIGGRTWEDIAWSYPDPIAECPRIKGLISFYNENVEAIRVDGRPVERPRTKWSKD
ncbi:MAG: DUF427 domain-containing protein [Alphaproteobacteria bacterium]|nr:DUF427 domain-containing protein [Alphaproteobacteria bacterium]